MQLGSRASKKYSDPNSWHNQFYSLVTTKIDEEIFKPLFMESSKTAETMAEKLGIYKLLDKKPMDYDM